MNRRLEILPDGTVERTRTELEAEVERLLCENYALKEEAAYATEWKGEAERLRKDNARLQAKLDYITYIIKELAEVHRLYANEAAETGSLLEHFHSGAAVAYEDVVDMIAMEVGADATQD